MPSHKPQPAPPLNQAPTGQGGTAPPLDLSHQALPHPLMVDPAMDPRGIELDPASVLNLMLDVAIVRAIKADTLSGDQNRAGRLSMLMDGITGEPRGGPATALDDARAGDQVYQALYVKFHLGEGALGSLLDCARHGVAIKETLDLLAPHMARGIAAPNTHQAHEAAQAVVQTARGLRDFATPPPRGLQDRSILLPTLPVIGTIALPVPHPKEGLGATLTTPFFGVREIPDDPELLPLEQVGATQLVQVLLEAVGGMVWINVDAATPRQENRLELNPIYTAGDQDGFVAVSPSDKPGDTGYYLRLFHVAPTEGFTAWYGTRDLAVAAADSFLADVVLERATKANLDRLAGFDAKALGQVVADLPLQGTGQIRRVFDVSSREEAITSIGAGQGLRPKAWQRRPTAELRAYLEEVLDTLNEKCGPNLELFWDDDPMYSDEPGLYLRDLTREPLPELALEPGTVEAQMDKYGWITLRYHQGRTIFQQDEAAILSTRAAVGFDRAEALDQGYPVVFAEPGYDFEEAEN